MRVAKNKKWLRVICSDKPSRYGNWEAELKRSLSKSPVRTISPVHIQQKTKSNTCMKYDNTVQVVALLINVLKRFEKT